MVMTDMSVKGEMVHGVRWPMSLRSKVVEERDEFRTRAWIKLRGNHQQTSPTSLLVVVMLLNTQTRHKLAVMDGFAALTQ